jgi:hypothetical protein
MRALAAIVLANLPVRHWHRFDEHFPLARVAWISGLAVMISGFAVGIPGFLFFLAEAASGFNEAVIRISPDHMVAKGWALGAPIAFFFGTWTGLLSLYLAGSGLLRFAEAFLADHPRGDFLLTGVDASARAIWLRARAYDQRKTREKQEGPPMPDRLVTGEALGHDDADLVVLASRAKADWEPRSYLVTADGTAYRIGQPFDVTLAGGLRTAYPLTELKTGEAIRHAIAYELPPLWRGIIPL